MRNYHIALTAALEEFIALQKNPPIVRLRLGDQFQLVRAQLFWVNTIADGLANEQLVGRIQNRTSSSRLSRACHCLQHLADDSKHCCKFLRQAAIERLVVAALSPLPTCQEWTEYLNSHGTNQATRQAEAALLTRKKVAESILKEKYRNSLHTAKYVQLPVRLKEGIWNLTGRKSDRKLFTLHDDKAFTSRTGTQLVRGTKFH